ncbi:MAG: MMPL family transporter [Solirubrobacteraceae bacterium]
MAVLLLSHVITLSSVSLSLDALIGLGVGIDYALLIVNRHIRALREGADVEASIAASMNTSGRSVIFAGGTVIVALLGMLILGFGFLSGMAIGAAVTVLLTVATALTLLPAFLAKAGPRVLLRSERAAWHLGRVLQGNDDDPRLAGAVPGGVWGRWAKLVQRRPVPTGVAALAVLLLLASPVMSLRLGSADASSDAPGSTTRTFYNTMAAGFGKGFEADLLLVARTPDSQSRQAWRTLVAELRRVADVASVDAPRAVGGDTLSMVTLQPQTAAQDQATSQLVHTLRDKLIKNAEAGSDLQVHVGGTTASNVDFANALTSKLPMYLVIIAALGFLLLALAFRSLLVPAIGAISNLLTIGVALGVTVAVFQWGWGPAQFGIGGQAPVEYVVAMLIIGVIFGLSMDYQVFLVSRIREEWVHAGDNGRAVTTGVTHTGKVIATAAAIMFCVFLSFGFGGLRTGSEFGVGLAIAVLADAFLVRMTIIPAIMRACGARNWAMPTWLDRALPNLSVEGPAEEEALQPVSTPIEPALAGV